MQALIAAAAAAGTTVQALFVTLGGLAGVFATLFAFWLLITVSLRLARGRPSGTPPRP
ncbi:MAG TPA: hypothetical protein VMV90_03705 [Rectinemataceae bacterium]|nr:hypothetical protein [Rectinemataceae bacterium]